MQSTRTLALLLWCAGLCTPSAGCAPSEPSAPRASAPARKPNLQTARSTAEAGSLRSLALEVLDEAHRQTPLSEALQLLGWVATEDDIIVLASFARSPDPVLADAAIEALGRVHTDAAQVALEGLLTERDPHDPAVLLAMGRSGHPRALRHLVPLLDDPRVPAPVPPALAAHGTSPAIHALVQALTAVDPTQVRSVAESLAALADTTPPARAALDAVLASRDSPRRSAVLHALAHAGDATAVVPLIEALTGLDAGSAVSAAQALGRLGSVEAVPALAQVARIGHARSRVASLEALAALKHPDADHALLEIVESAPERHAARAAAFVRGAHDPGVRARMFAAHTARPGPVAAAVAAQLFAVEWPAGQVPGTVLALAWGTLEGPEEHAWTALPVLLSPGGPGDIVRIERAVLSSRDPVVAVAPIAAVRTPNAGQLLLRLTEAEPASVRHAARAALFARGVDPETVAFRTMADLGSGGADEASSADLLGRLGTPGVSSFLLRRATNAEGGAAITAAATAIATHGTDHDARDLLDRADRVPDERRRALILDALVGAELLEPEQIISRALESSSPALHETAARALALEGTAEASSRLVVLSESSAARTRHAALGALSSLGGAPAEDRLIAALDHPDDLDVALRGLNQLATGPALDAVFDAAFLDEDPAIRSEALRHLPSQTDVARSAAMLTLAVRDDDSEAVRFAAIAALASLGTDDALDALTTLADDAVLDGAGRAEVVRALRRLGVDLPAPIDTGL